jgi:hypothetical protein
VEQGIKEYYILKIDKVPRTPCVPMDKFLSRDQLMIYKKKNYAPDYQPNFEFGRKGLGSCGAAFDRYEERKDIFVKKPEYTNETYFEFEKYSRSPKSNLFKRYYENIINFIKYHCPKF